MQVFKNKVASEVQAIENEKGSKLRFKDIQPLVAGDRGRKAEKDIRSVLTIGKLASIVYCQKSQK